jgi:hypothetical protein
VSVKPHQFPQRFVVGAREVDLRSNDRVVDTDSRMSEAAKNWTAAIDRVYAARVQEVLAAAHKRSMM